MKRRDQKPHERSRCTSSKGFSSSTASSRYPSEARWFFFYYFYLYLFSFHLFVKRYTCRIYIYIYVHMHARSSLLRFLGFFFFLLVSLLYAHGHIYIYKHAVYITCVRFLCEWGFRWFAGKIRYIRFQELLGSF